MTADTLVKLALSHGAHPWGMVGSAPASSLVMSPDALEAFAAALQGRAQEGEPSDAGGVEVAPEFQAEVDRMSEEAIARWAAVRKNAARYEFLRDVAWNQGSLIFYAERYGPEDWDAHIDAALAQASRVEIGEAK